jgi:hypothetical protein
VGRMACKTGWVESVMSFSFSRGRRQKKKKTTTVHGWTWRSLRLLKAMRKLGTEEHPPKSEEPLDIMEL